MDSLTNKNKAAIKLAKKRNARKNPDILFS